MGVSDPGTTFEFEYLREFKIKFEKIQGMNQMRLIQENKKVRKSQASVPQMKDYHGKYLRNTIQYLHDGVKQPRM
jgi:hypothetical protein